MDKTKKRLRMHLVIIFIFWAALYCSSCTFKPEKKACIGGVCVVIEVVDSEPQRQLGLMFREKLEGDKGMLFVYDRQGRHSFWMKNMRFPLDIIWINREKEIVAIDEDVPACRQGQDCPEFSPPVEVKYILEVNAGFTRKNKVRVGEKVSF